MTNFLKKMVDGAKDKVKTAAITMVNAYSHAKHELITRGTAFVQIASHGAQKMITSSMHIVSQQMLTMPRRLIENTDKAIFGSNILHTIARKDNVEAAEELAQKNSDAFNAQINSPNAKGYTSLDLAHSQEMKDFLVASGGKHAAELEKNAATSYERKWHDKLIFKTVKFVTHKSALRTAIGMGSINRVRELYYKDETQFIKELGEIKHDKTPLDEANQLNERHFKHKKQIIAFLTEKGGKTKEQIVADNEKTPLHIAVLKGDIAEIYRLYTDNEAEFKKYLHNIKSDKTPLDEAYQLNEYSKHKQEIIAFFLSKGARTKAEIVVDNEKTPLHIAVLRGDIAELHKLYANNETEFRKYLYTIKSDKTPLDEAYQLKENYFKQKQEIINFLLLKGGKTKEQICKEAVYDQFIEKTIQAKTILPESNIHRIVDDLLDVRQGFSEVLWNTPGLLEKYFAHLAGWEGEIKHNHISIKLHGIKQHEYLPMRIRTFLTILNKLTHTRNEGLPSADSIGPDTQRERLINIIRQEIKSDIATYHVWELRRYNRNAEALRFALDHIIRLEEGEYFICASGYTNPESEIILMPKMIEDNPELAEEGKLYLKNDGTYLSRFRNILHKGSVLTGAFSDPTIDLNRLEVKILNFDFKKKILNIALKREHACSGEAHAVYINFLREGDFIHIRVDNLGGGYPDNHQHFVGKHKPTADVKSYMIGVFNRKDFSETSKLGEYIKGLIQAFYEKEKKALELIYNTNDVASLSDLSDDEKTKAAIGKLPDLKAQTVGNCCVKNRQITLRLRALKYDESGVLYKFIRGYEEEVVGCLMKSRPNVEFPIQENLKSTGNSSPSAFKMQDSTNQLASERPKEKPPIKPKPNLGKELNQQSQLSPIASPNQLRNFAPKPTPLNNSRSSPLGLGKLDKADIENLLQYNGKWQIIRNNEVEFIINFIPSRETDAKISLEPLFKLRVLIHEKLKPLEIEYQVAQKNLLIRCESKEQASDYYHNLCALRNISPPNSKLEQCIIS